MAEAPTARSETDIGSALYPSMAPRAQAPTHPATEMADALAALYPSMAPRSSDAASAPDSPDAPDTLAIPEAHWARVEDVERWEAEVTASPLAAQLPAAREFLKAHAPKEVIQMLHQTGYGSNPHVIRFVADLAAKFSGGQR